MARRQVSNVWSLAGVRPEQIRRFVGTEDVCDLLRDLDHACERAYA